MEKLSKVFCFGGFFLFLFGCFFLFIAAGFESASSFYKRTVGSEEYRIPQYTAIGIMYLNCQNKGGDAQRDML